MGLEGGGGLTLAGYFHSVSGYAGFGEAVGFLEVLAAAGAGVAGDWEHGGGEVGLWMYGGGGNVEGRVLCLKRGHAIYVLLCLEVSFIDLVVINASCSSAY